MQLFIQLESYQMEATACPSFFIQKLTLRTQEGLSTALKRSKSTLFLIIGITRKFRDLSDPK